MGERVARNAFGAADRTTFHEKLVASLAVFDRMLSEGCFAIAAPLTGMEIELNLVEHNGEPALRNAQVLAQINDPAFVQELGKFNLEINVAPQGLTGAGIDQYEARVRGQLNNAEQLANVENARLVMIGILPTLQAEHLTAGALSSNTRFALLDEEMRRQRGEDLRIEIRGAAERFEMMSRSIAPEAACTSVQFHLQVNPESFGRYWNAAQCLAGAQIALGANSPYFMGRELWAETRIPLFTQAAEARSAAMKSKGVRPRVWFGERWIDGPHDLYSENLKYFPPLLPVPDHENPDAVFESGVAPELGAFRLHNGTIWRWNRPVYDVVNGRAHLRIENRVLPAGPTVVDVLANGAFYFGAVRALADSELPAWRRLAFSAAEANFTGAARSGLESSARWPGLPEVPTSELILDHLLPLADDGLRAWGVHAHIRERLLGIVEKRCRSGQTGAKWQVESVRALEAVGVGRTEALRRMTQGYVERMHSNEPVHEWSII